MPLRDGQRISLGEVTLDILATPGHTPESISIVVYEHPDNEVPYGVLTGDTLFVGDVGRPDLLAGTGLSSETLARTLFGSLHDKLLKLPDATRVFPAHGAGSACGKQLSSETSSTIGEQRRDNYALQFTDVDEFVAAITQASRRDRITSSSTRCGTVNCVRCWTRARRRCWTSSRSMSAPNPERFCSTPGRQDAYASGHLRGAVNIGLQGRYRRRRRPGHSA